MIARMGQRLIAWWRSELCRMFGHELVYASYRLLECGQCMDHRIVCQRCGKLTFRPRWRSRLCNIHDQKY